MSMNDPSATTFAVEISGPVRPVSVPVTTTDATPFKTSACLYGWSFVETTGAAGAQVDLYDGADESGQYIGSVMLASGASDTQLPGQVPLQIRTGLYVKVVSGSVKGAVYVSL